MKSQITDAEAYKLYNEWLKTQVPSEPLYTYSGWIRANTIEITDDEWAEKNEPPTK